jgi:hypothetical protein
MRFSICLVAILFSPLAISEAAIITYSVDPASPAIDGNITPDDVLGSGPSVVFQGATLGLQDDFFGGSFDVLNALSYGSELRKRPIFFSVDRVTVGLPGSDVHMQAAPGSEEAAGDVFKTLPPSGTNDLYKDEETLGLTPGFFGDDLDALELNEFEDFVYFSIDSLSATNGFGAGGFADDILISDAAGSFSVFADGVSDIGLLPGDDLDALILHDGGRRGVLDSGDIAFFSLSPFSPSTFTFTGNPYAPGVQGSLSPADILATDFTGSFRLLASAPETGNEPSGNNDALSMVPEPASVFIWGLVVFLLATRSVLGSRP